MFSFDEETHTYRWNGDIVPSVSEILVDVGLVNTQFYTVEARDRGTAVHLACEYLDREELDWDSVSESILPYMKAWEKFRMETGFIPELIEEKVFHPELYFAGTLDRTGVLFDRHVVLDIKTGSTIPKTVGLQLAAYDIALGRESHSVRVAIQLFPDESYKIHTFDNPLDYDAFEGAINLYHWKKSGKRKKKAA